MEKTRLMQFEKKCIQEEPPFCKAACPFHVDVKGFTQLMAEQQLDRAYKILEKTLPLPRILARICDHPCEDHCIRSQVDAPVAVGALERICAAGTGKDKKHFLPPAKTQTVGIWGTGLSSLVAAWDLSLKGYPVTVFHRSGTAGGDLLTLSEDVLPHGILAQEMERLTSFGVTFQAADAADQVFKEDRAEQFDALYIGCDAPGKPFSHIDWASTGIPRIEAFSLATSEPGIFAGGFSRTGKEKGDKQAYPVAFAAQGRKAATSIDRLLSGVSGTAGREREGEISTRLTTDISRVVRRKRILSAFGDTRADGAAVSRETAAREAGRCIQCDCSRCIRVCAYIAAFKGHPGQYAREIYNNAAIVMGERKANLLVNSCSLCGLCETVCPNDFSMADLCLEARRDMVEKGRMPVSAHAFALQEMAHASGSRCFFARHAPGKDRSDRLFFPGCQLLGSSPSQAARVYEFVQIHLAGSTGLVTGCCGAPAVWAGRPEEAEQAIASFTSFWESAGRPPVMTACPSCAVMLAQQLPGIRITSLYRELVSLMEHLPEAAPASQLSENISIVDPCTAREDAPVQEAVRTLTRSAGLSLQELTAAGELTECCGFGGLVFNANPGLSKTIIQRRADQSGNDYLTYCAMCRDRLAMVGKPALHLLDLFWPSADRPADRLDPGFSGRHDNLVRAKHWMLSTLWGESPRDTPSDEFRPLHFAPGVSQIMEDAFILPEDIQAVLAHYETGAPHFEHRERDSCIAFYRPENVCFWVEFQEKPSGYKVLNTWSHRMTVVEDRSHIPGSPADARAGGISCRTCQKELGYYKHHVAYLGSRFDVVLPQCSGCGIIYISPETARGKMAEVEKILEDK